MLHLTTIAKSLLTSTSLFAWNLVVLTSLTISLLQAQGLSAAALLDLAPAAAASFIALPVAVISAAVVQVLMAAYVKHTLVGSIEPGVHRCCPSNPLGGYALNFNLMAACLNTQNASYCIKKVGA